MLRFLLLRQPLLVSICCTNYLNFPNVENSDHTVCCCTRAAYVLEEEIPAHLQTFHYSYTLVAVGSAGYVVAPAGVSCVWPGISCTARPFMRSSVVIGRGPRLSLVARSSVESWGRSWCGFNCGRIKIRRRYIER